MTDTFHPPMGIEQRESGLFIPETVKRPTTSVFFPVFEEARRQETDIEGNLLEPGYAVKQAVTRQMQFLDEEFAGDHEFFVVDDGSEDENATIDLMKTLGVRVIVNEDGANSQRGGALKLGFLEATGDYRLYTDADGSYSPETLYKMYEKLASGEADIATAFRAESENDSHSSISRRIGHIGMHKLCELFAYTGVSDPQAGAKGFTAKSAEDLWSQVESKGWAADREVLAIANLFGFKIVEIGASIESHDDSTVDIVTDSARMVRDSLEMAVRLGIIDNRFLKKIAETSVKPANNIVSVAEKRAAKQKREKAKQLLHAA